MILIGLAAVGMLTIVNAKDNADAVETIDFESIINNSVDDDDDNENDENTGLSDIDTQQLGIFGAGVYKLDEIEVPTEASIDETSDEASTESDDENINEYADLAIANVTNYVNVRSNPDTESEIVGKIYNGAVAQVLSTAGDNDDWFQVVSGNVEGYIKSEFFIYGDDAATVIDNYVTRYAVVIADRLNVREEPDKDSKRIGYIDNGEQVKFIEDLGEWYKVEYTDGKFGYVASEYVTIKEEFVYAKTIEEEQAEIAAAKVLEERETVSEETVSENVTITVTPPSANYSSSSELRNSIVDYAMQFLGNKYVHGGQSLVTGTDCSGFTSLIYAQFGYSISRTPSGQLSSNGRSISLSEAQPGDIICYGSSGKCTHVALYIGNGQIIHSANSKKGVIISSATYDTILGVKNVID
jgi:cell wall-associated NlpC family hydrolase